MSRINKSSPGFSEDDLVDTFEGVLKEYGVISRKEVQALINKRMDEITKADEARVADNPEEFGEGTNTYDPTDLQELLPDDVWEVVRTYLAGAGAPMPEDNVEGSDVEKSVNSALFTSRDSLNRVRGNATAPVSKADREPAYSSTEDAEGSPGDMLLKHIETELGTPTEAVNASVAKDKPNHPTLTHVDEADL